MKRDRTASSRHGRGEHGQVLILAIVALILVIIAALLLFDVQAVIRGKVKAQNGVDAAALTAAEWQKHSLNLIGELNLIRATGTLISDPFFARGVLDNPNSNAAEFFSDLPQPLTQEEFTLFPEKAEFYYPDGSLNTEKLVEEIVRVEKEKRFLDALDDLVSQLQTRISFVGPLIGFGAAQQAAKNNGLTFDLEASEDFIEYLNEVGNDGIYEHSTPAFINDYAWRTPYLSMLESILDYSVAQNEFTGRTENRAYGIAAWADHTEVGMPRLTANPPTDLSGYLGNPRYYEMIHARDWCGLDNLLRLDFSGNWWSGFECEFDYDFSEESEILPLHIDFTDSVDKYNTARDEKALSRYLEGGNRLFSDLFNDENPYEYEVSDDVETSEEHDGNKHKYYTFTKINITIDAELFEQTYNDKDADRRYDLLPRLSWATYDPTWSSINDNGTEDNDQDDIDMGWLRGSFKQGMDYHSGARAYFLTHQSTATVSGSMGRPRRGIRSPDIGQVFANTDARGNAMAISYDLNMLNNTNRKIETDAKARPLGRIRTEDGSFLRPFEAGRMILPIFTETALIPIFSEPSETKGGLGGRNRRAWIRYLKEFVPLLSESSSIQDAWDQAAQLYPNHLGDFAYYVAALNLLDDPDFRQAGLDWLGANRENCNKRKVGGGGGGLGSGGYSVPSKGGPSSLH